MPVYSPAVSTRARRVIVLDTETTGLTPYDRIITLGAVRIEGDEIQRQGLHLIFDPRKNCDPGAARVHGYDDWTLRHQDLFASLAPGIYRWLSWADELVMHNAAFDLHYVLRELRKSGQPVLDRPHHCTMLAARNLWRLPSARLDSCLQHLGIPPRGQRHGALEDAFLTAVLHLQQTGVRVNLPDLSNLPGPKNYRQPPPRPEGELPRRPTKKPVPWPPSKP